MNRITPAPLELLELPADTIDVAVVRTSDVDHALLQRYWDLLNSAEHARWERYRVASAREQFLIARAIVRTTLSRYLPVRPVDWDFTSNEYGRPEIARSTPGLPSGPTLRFNLSHTTGLVAIAVAWQRDVGLDVEFVNRRTGGVHLAERYFSEAEVADLHALPTAAQHSAFFDYWTLKEAYIKARGQGLAIPLAAFSYHFDHPGGPRISFSDSIADDPRLWRFWQESPSSEHRLAVAAKCVHASEKLVIRRLDLLSLAELAVDR